MNFPGGAGQSPGQQQSLAAPGGPVPVPVPGPSGPQPGGPPPPQFGLSNSAAIRAEIGRFESVHPNIYAIYDLIERVEDLALQSQIREHVISIEGEHRRPGTDRVTGNGAPSRAGRAAAFVPTAAAPAPAAARGARLSPARPGPALPTAPGSRRALQRRGRGCGGRAGREGGSQGDTLVSRPRSGPGPVPGPAAMVVAAGTAQGRGLRPRPLPGAAGGGGRWSGIGAGGSVLGFDGERDPPEPVNIRNAENCSPGSLNRQRGQGWSRGTAEELRKCSGTEGLRWSRGAEMELRDWVGAEGLGWSLEPPWVRDRGAADGLR